MHSKWWIRVTVIGYIEHNRKAFDSVFAAHGLKVVEEYPHVSYQLGGPPGGYFTGQEVSGNALIAECKEMDVVGVTPDGMLAALAQDLYAANGTAFCHILTHAQPMDWHPTWSEYLGQLYHRQVQMNLGHQQLAENTRRLEAELNGKKPRPKKVAAKKGTAVKKKNEGSTTEP